MTGGRVRGVPRSPCVVDVVVAASAAPTRARRDVDVWSRLRPLLQGRRRNVDGLVAASAAPTRARRNGDDVVAAATAPTGAKRLQERRKPRPRRPLRRKRQIPPTALRAV